MTTEKSRNLCALVIDDASTARHIMCEILGELGFETRGAADGRAGQTEIERGGVDLVTIDLHMPQVDGMEFLRWLRAQSGLAEIAAVMVTTENELAIVERALALGADEFIMKPFDRKVVASKLALLGFSVDGAAPPRREARL